MNRFLLTEKEIFSLNCENDFDIFFKYQLSQGSVKGGGIIYVVLPQKYEKKTKVYFYNESLNFGKFDYELCKQVLLNTDLYQQLLKYDHQIFISKSNSLSEVFFDNNFEEIFLDEIKEK